MSSQTNAVFGVLLLAQVLCTFALPVLDPRSTTEPCVLSAAESCIDNLQQREGTESDENTDAALQRQKRRGGGLLFNSYMIEFYSRTPGLKKSNCTETFLGQAVSPYLCTSDRVVYTLLKAPVEPLITYDNRQENNTYELCSNVSRTSDEDILLGHDFVIYKRPLDVNDMLEVFMTQLVNDTQPWEVLVDFRRIPANASGWQVFQIHPFYTNPTVPKQVCVYIYIRVETEPTVFSEPTLFSKADLTNLLVLDQHYPREDLYKPFSVTFMENDEPYRLPYFKKRLVETSNPSTHSNVRECSLQDRIVNLQEHLPFDVLYPTEANIGTCVFDSADQSTQYEEEEEEEEEEELESGSGLDPADKDEDSYLHVAQCVPTLFEDLPVLLAYDSFLAMVNLPNIVTKECRKTPD